MFLVCKLAQIHEAHRDKKRVFTCKNFCAVCLDLRTDYGDYSLPSKCLLYNLLCKALSLWTGGLGDDENSFTGEEIEI